MCRVPAVQTVPINRCSVVIFTLSGTVGSTDVFESRVALNMGLGDVKNVASAITKISHELIQ